jgi:hypothetical protein
VESVGGTIFCQYYNALGLRDCIKGNTHRLLAAPVRRADIGELSWFLLNARLIVYRVVYQLAEQRLSVSYCDWKNAWCR